MSVITDFLKKNVWGNIIDIKVNEIVKEDEVDDIV